MESEGLGLTSQVCSFSAVCHVFTSDMGIVTPHSVVIRIKLDNAWNILSKHMVSPQQCT